MERENHSRTDQSLVLSNAPAFLAPLSFRLHISSWKVISVSDFDKNHGSRDLYLSVPASAAVTSSAFAVQAREMSLPPPNSTSRMQKGATSILVIKLFIQNILLPIAALSLFSGSVLPLFSFPILGCLGEITDRMGVR